MTTPIEKHWHGNEYHDCERLGVTITRATGSGPIARIVVVHLLTRDENNGNHNLYMDVIDANNKRLDGSYLRGLNWTIPLRSMIDKPVNEPGANFSLSAGDTVMAWVESAPGYPDIASDDVRGINTRWGGDIVGGQDYGHISYYVIWKIQNGTETPPVDPPENDQLAELQARVTVLEGKIKAIKAICG